MKSAVVQRGARAAGTLDQFEVLLHSETVVDLQAAIAPNLGRHSYRPADATITSPWSALCPTLRSLGDEVWG